jgi:hypothetical protein
LGVNCSANVGRSRVALGADWSMAFGVFASNAK